MSALHYIDGEWHRGNPPIMGPMTHAAWMSSVAFDGARAFGGTAPDLDLHCVRAVRSAIAMGLAPTVEAREIEALAWQGIDQFPEGTELYIRPIFYAEDGFVVPEPDSTKFVLSLFEFPLPEPTGFSACLSSIRRPSPETAPTEAKASCLYPQNARALREAKVKGYKNAVVLDMNGNVAEFATANLFIAIDGAVHTPVPNRTFLAGITRQRVIGLLRDAGTEVVERTLVYAEVCAADEVFSTGNYAKVSPAIRIEDRDLQPGPVYRQARELYFDFARACVRGARI